MGEVVVGLLGEPGFGGATEDFGEADGHFGGDAALSVDELGESGASDTEGGGGLGDGEAERLDALAQDRAPWMGWILHRHGLDSFNSYLSAAPFTRNASMIIEIVDVERSAVGETKAFQLPLERMKPETRQIQVGYGSRGV
jgi:hypothetical protein